MGLYKLYRLQLLCSNQKFKPTHKYHGKQVDDLISFRIPVSMEFVCVLLLHLFTISYILCSSRRHYILSEFV